MALFAHPYEMAANLTVRDEDAAEFLQSQFSNDLRPFSTGQCTYGLWLDVKGKLVADSWVLCEGEESFRVLSEHCEGQLIMEKLDRHLIADDVELELGPRLKALAVVGDAVDELSPDSGPEPWSFAGRRSNLPSRELIFSDEGSRSEWIREHACEIVSEGWLQNERMKAGIPLVGVEALPGDLPAEAGLVEEAVSLTKGCFLGQEVVARLHNLGRPQRGLFKLCGSGAPPEGASSITNDSGKLLGDLRASVAVATGWTGVAMLKARFVTAGGEVSVEGRSAKVEGSFSEKGSYGAA